MDAISDLVELLSYRAVEQPDRTAYIFLKDGESEESRITHQVMDIRARSIAVHLRKYAATGERALLLYPPGPEYIAAFFGCLYAGITAVPAYPPHPARLERTLPRLINMIKNARPSLLLTQSSVLSDIINHSINRLPIAKSEKVRNIVHAFGKKLIHMDWIKRFLPEEYKAFSRLHWICTDEIPHRLASRWEKPSINGDSLAFLQYTSGSTGDPKGVMVSHGNLLYNSELISSCFQNTPESTGVIWLPPYHDMGLIGGLLQPLYGGFPVVFMSPIAFLQKPFRWLHAISSYRADVSGGPNFAYDLCSRKLTPEQISSLDLSCWHTAFNGAEPIRPDTLERFSNTFAPCGFRKNAFFPCYGLAEATLIVSGGASSDPPILLNVNGDELSKHQVVLTNDDSSAQTLIGCGKNLGDQRIVIVNPKTFEHCDPNEVGEIWISGKSVAHGYWQRHEETQAVFHAYLSDSGDGPFLRTGDLGFVHHDELYITGREKDVIIIRGRNHYPQDIELTVEISHPRIRPGCTAAFETEIEGEKQLVVAAEIERRRKGSGLNGDTDSRRRYMELPNYELERDEPLDLQHIIQAIRQSVSEHHELRVHSVQLLKLGSIPKTSSGKIQRHACKQGFIDGTLNLVVSDSPRAFPAEHAEEKIPANRQEIIESYLIERASFLLKIDKSDISSDQTLTSLGLDSMTAIELTHHLETDLGVILPLTRIIEGATIRQIAMDAMKQAPIKKPDPKPSKPMTDALSDNQKSLWFLHCLAPESSAYNLAFAVRIRSIIHVDRFQQAMQSLISRHASLRTTFTMKDGIPIRNIAELNPQIVEIIDASAWSDDFLKKHLLAEVRRPFDLESGPIMRVQLFHRSDADTTLLMSIHHIATDLWSFSLLLDELDKLYPDPAASKAASPQITYSDYVRWQADMISSPAGDRLLNYWRQALSGHLPPLELPLDFPRPPVQTYTGDSYSFHIDRELTLKVKTLAKSSDTTLFMTLLAAFNVLLYRYTGQTDIVIGSPAAGRTRAEFDRTVGYFVNPIAIRSNLSDTPAFSDFLSRVRRIALDALAHQDYPFQRLVEQLRPVRDPSRSPIFQVMFVLQKPYRVDASAPFVLKQPGAQMQIGGLDMESFPLEERISQFDLTLTMAEAHEELIASFEYNTDLFRSETIARMAEHYRTLLKGIVENSDQTVSELPILSDDEFQILETFHEIIPDESFHRSVIEAFESQVRKSPHHPAIVFENTTLTYYDLNERANRIAHYLRANFTIQPDSRIGILLERSEWMIIGILGILKAGAAYVPMDPMYPMDRIRHIISDSDCITVLSDSESWRVPAMAYTDIRSLTHDQTENPVSITLPQHLAYVIYTSGSTGVPKGVMIEHHSVMNMVRGLGARLYDRFDEPIRESVTAPFVFDVTVQQIFTNLTRGNTLYIATDDVRYSPEAFRQFIENGGIHNMDITPGFFASLLEQKFDLPDSVRHINLGAEALPPVWVREFYTRPNHQPITLANIYGPTEACVNATLFFMDSDYDPVSSTIPIGKPLPNVRVNILDVKLNPVPIGVTGEICLSGVGLARGYLNNPELTDRAFVQREHRLYRTGDIGRWLPDGTIEFFGRNDDQVKIRGYRIEPGEIENRLMEHPDITSVAVIARHTQLIAYFRSPASVSVETLKNHLKMTLPDYMIPSYFVQIEHFPLTPGGKVDRRALPDPQPLRPHLDTELVLPANDAEKKIAAIWKDVLNLDNIGIHDNFFDLGGYSLLAVQVHSRLKDVFDRNIPVSDLFRYPTIDALAKHLDTRHGLTRMEARHELTRMNTDRDLHRSIAVIGMAIRFPGADSVDDFWRNLCDGVESITFFTDSELIEAGIDPGVLKHPNYVKARGIIPNVEMFDSFFFGFSPREAENMDVQHRLFLECAWEAMEHAGISQSIRVHPGLMGVFAGSGMNTYFLNHIYPSREFLSISDMYQVMISNDKDALATITAYKLGLKGPSVVIQSACSTSLVAVHIACQSLLNGESDMALAGGVSIDVPQLRGYQYESGMILSPDGHCRAFDAQAKGTVSGNGCGIVVLKRLSDAVRDGDTIHAVIRGSAINNDGSLKMGYTAPGGAGQHAVIERALTAAGVKLETISYVETHGTGTPLGDPVEIAALTEAFGTTTSGYCAIGSVKTNIGHLDTASGVAGLIKTVLMLEHKQIPPSLHYQSPNPEIDFEHSPFYVNTRLTEWKSNGSPRRAGVSSFGIGGTNAHVVLEEFVPADHASDSRPWQLVPLSAKTHTALEHMTTRLMAYIHAHPEIDLADAAYTLQVGRKAFDYRQMSIVRYSEDRRIENHRTLTNFQAPENLPVVFMFTGQGSQYVNMGKELYETEPTFRNTVARCSEILTPYLNADLRDVIYPASAPEYSLMDQTFIAQPCLFVIEYALAALWMEWGIRPYAMIGHSIGEYVAACIAGVFSLEDALRLVVERGRSMQTIPHGTMLAVSLSESNLLPYLEPFGEAISLAAVNSPLQCVVSGESKEIEALESAFVKDRVHSIRLHTSHAFHSQMMDPVMESFKTQVSKIRLNSPTLPYISNVTGTWITPSDATNPDYYAKHLRQTVRFGDGIRNLLASKKILLEVGPGQTLSSLALQSEREVISVSSIRHLKDEQSDLAFMLTTLGRLWLAGVEPDWNGFHAHESRKRIPLPTYPFDRKRCWIEPNASRLPPIISGKKTAGKKSDVSEWFYLPLWKQSPSPECFQKPTIAKPLNWLIFADPHGYGMNIAQHLVEMEQRVNVVQIGFEFARIHEAAFQLNPEQPEDYDSLFMQLREKDALPSRIVHLWSLSSESSSDMTDFYRLLYLAKSLENQKISSSIQLDIISDHMLPAPGNKAIFPEKATLSSLITVISQEYPNISCRAIDLIDKESSICRLLAELTSPPTEKTVALAKNGRWIQHWEAVRLAKPVEPLPLLKENGVYLITGGLGGIGMILARDLGKRLRAKLVLTGRSGLPARNEWDAFCREHEDSDRTVRRIQIVKEIEAAGGEVLPIGADVADVYQMENVVRQAEAKFGALNGVIHAAGIAGMQSFRTIQETDKAFCARQFQSKITGLYVLEKILKHKKLDFCLLMSSLASVLGGVGSASYSAANSFMDAFAACRWNDAHPETTWISVNWDSWHSEDETEPRTSIAEFAMSADEGIQAFQRILSTSNLSRIIVSTGDLHERINRWVKPNAESGKRHDRVGKTEARSNFQSAFVPPSDDIEMRIAELWQDHLGIEQVGIHDNFFELGGHSLLAVQLMARLRDTFQKEFTLETFIKQPTIAQIAEHIRTLERGEK